MTDTHEAVRLADDLEQLASEGASLIHLQSGAYICQKFAEAAALLRRIPELEAGMQEQAEKIKQQALQIISLDGQAQVLQEERDRLSAIVEGRAAGCQCGDDDVCKIVKERDRLLSALKDLVDVMSESMGTGGWVPSPLHSSFLHAMISAKQALPPATQGSEE